MANKPKDVKKIPATENDNFKVTCMNINNIISFEDRVEKLGLKVNGAVEVLSTNLGKECMNIPAYNGGIAENMVNYAEARTQIESKRKKAEVENDNNKQINYAKAKSDIEIKKSREQFENKKKQRESENDSRGIG